MCTLIGSERTEFIVINFFYFIYLFIYFFFFFEINTEMTFGRAVKNQIFTRDTEKKNL